MLSTLIELLALAGLVKTASLFAGWAAWLVGSLGLGFVGYALADSPVDAKAGLLVARARLAWRRQIVRETNRAGSPHPPIRVDPEMDKLAARLAEARLRRAARGDRTVALSRAGYNGDDG